MNTKLLKKLLISTAIFVVVGSGISFWHSSNFIIGAIIGLILALADFARDMIAGTYREAVETCDEATKCCKETSEEEVVVAERTLTVKDTPTAKKTRKTRKSSKSTKTNK